jgi:ribonuclease J
VIDIMGVPDKDRRGKPIADLIADTVGQVLDSLPKARRRDSEAVEDAVARAVRSAVNNVWGKKPACHVLVVEI